MDDAQAQDGRQARISGYTYGQAQVAESPLDLDDLERLKQTVLFTDDDAQALRMAGDVLEDQVEDVLDVWYDFVGSHDFLVRYFSTPDGEPIDRYLTSVRERFGQWILDTCRRPYDQEWLDYQEEIALRHHRTKKNRTDDVDAVDQISLRYVLGFIYPITATIRPFLENGDHEDDAVDRMHDAWFKAVVLQATLWARPYVREGDF